jgi:hypothetical protein
VTVFATPNALVRPTSSALADRFDQVIKLHEMLGIEIWLPNPHACHVVAFLLLDLAGVYV